MKVLSFLRRNWVKFTISGLLILLVISTTLWAGGKAQDKESRAEQIRTVLLECTTPGSLGDPHPCFEQIQLQSQQRNSKVIAHAIEVLAIDNDCRLRRTLWGLPAPEERDENDRLIPCPDQTPHHIYPGDGRQPPL